MQAWSGYKAHSSQIIRCLDRYRLSTVGKLQSMVDALGDPILPTDGKSDHEKPVLRIEQRNCFFKAFAAVKKKFQTQRRHHGKCGLGIDESKHDHVKALPGGARLMEECATVVD